LVNKQAFPLKMMKLQERNHPDNASSPKQPLRLSFTSGKGGVGKSNIALNTAIMLAGFNQKVLLVDADINLANLDILLGLNPPFNLSDVFTGDKQIQDIIMSGPGGVNILPGSSGVIEMMNMDQQVQRQLLESFQEIEKNYDYLIIDTGAGLSSNVIAYASAADEAVVVTTHEPTSFTDAYAMIKVLSHRNPHLHIHILVNMVQNADDAADVYDKLNLVVQNFLNFPVDYLGFIPMDLNIASAVASQSPFVIEFPKCPATISLRLAVRKILNITRKREPGQDRSFLGRLFTDKE